MTSDAYSYVFLNMKFATFEKKSPDSIFERKLDFDGFTSTVDCWLKSVFLMASANQWTYRKNQET